MKNEMNWNWNRNRNDTNANGKRIKTKRAERSDANKRNFISQISCEAHFLVDSLCTEHFMNIYEHLRLRYIVSMVAMRWNKKEQHHSRWRIGAIGRQLASRKINVMERMSPPPPPPTPTTTPTIMAATVTRNHCGVSCISFSYKIIFCISHWIGVCFLFTHCVIYSQFQCEFLSRVWTRAAGQNYEREKYTSKNKNIEWQRWIEWEARDMRQIIKKKEKIKTQRVKRGWAKCREMA